MIFSESTFTANNDYFKFNRVKENNGQFFRFLVLRKSDFYTLSKSGLANIVRPPVGVS